MADEKKRIIDLSELSQEVQVGQYILVDSASGTGKMNLKKIVDDRTTSLAERVTDLETGLTEEENARIAADTELSGNVSNLQTALETKADNDGYYPDLYAGNLSSTKKQTDSTPYLMRKTGGDLSRVGEREDDTLVGATVNVNQLFNQSNVEYGAFPFTKNGIEFTLSDGRIILNGTATADTSALGFAKIVSGHKYYRKNLKSNPFNIYSYYPLDDESIVNATGDNGYAVITIPNGTTVTNYEYCGMLIDLTAMFGSTIADYLYSIETATAGAGIAKLREWGFLTGEYIPYNVGSLESVEATAHKMVGFNQFDGELVAGYWDPSTGAFVGGGANWKACKNYIKCVPNTAYAYFATGSENSKGNIVFYDASKNFISVISGGTGAGVSLFTTPSNCRYFTFYLSTEFSDNICINISNPDRNGEYEPYSAHTYDLGTDTLRGLFKLDSNNELYADGDTKASDGVITRKYGVVDLGTLTWSRSGDSPEGGNLFITSGLLAANGNLNFLCGKYPNSGVSAPRNIPNVSSGCSVGNKNFYIRDDSYTDAATFKSAMSGQYLVYELATPTTEQSTPFQNPQICDPDGTEEYVTSNGVPVGHVTEYDYDIKGLAEELIDVPDVPSSNGTYVLKATRTADGLSYSWVAG